jgi:hypothetical protein
MRLADLKYRELKSYGCPVSQNLYNPDNQYIYRVLYSEDVGEEEAYSVVTAFDPNGRDISTHRPIDGLDFMDIDAFTAAMLIARFEPTKPAKHKARRTTGTNK